MRIYFASALFNSRETLFNLELSSRLELGRNGLRHRVLLPQRDGFEFSSLGETLRARLPAAEAETAVQRIIYTLDLGGFLSRSDAVVAVLDEPLDEGVLIEIAYGRRLGLPVVGIRTDSRCPFGSQDDAMGGMHFFAGFQCTRFIRVSPLRRIEELDELASGILDALEAESSQGAIAAGKDPRIDHAADRLFEGIDVLEDDLHSAATIRRIVENYVDSRKLFDDLAPLMGVPHNVEAATAVT